MPVFKYAHMCEYARAEANGMVSLIGIFDTITVPSFPARFPMLHVIANMAGARGEQFDYATRIAAPDGAILHSVQPVRVHFEQENARTNQISGYLNTVFPAAGQYMVEFLIDNTVVYSLPLNVHARGMS